MIRHLKTSIPFLLILLLLYLPIDNLYRFLGFISVPLVFYWPLNRREILLFLFASAFFAIQDYSAIKSDFFRFTDPDLFQLPYWEFVAWGFWLLFSYRALGQNFPRRIDFRLVVMAMVFASSFSLPLPKTAILGLSAGIVVITVLITKSVQDIKYAFFYAGMGGLVEAVGLYRNMWFYPNADLLVAAIQFVVMWAGIGVFFRNLAGPFLLGKQSEERSLRGEAAFEHTRSGSSIL